LNLGKIQLLDDSVPHDSPVESPLLGAVLQSVMQTRGMTSADLSQALQRQFDSAGKVTPGMISDWRANKAWPSERVQETLDRLLIDANPNIPPQNKEKEKQEFKELLAEVRQQPCLNHKQHKESTSWFRKLLALCTQVGLENPSTFVHALKTQWTISCPEWDAGELKGPRPWLVEKILADEAVPSVGLMMGIIRALEAFDPDKGLSPEAKAVLYDAQQDAVQAAIDRKEATKFAKQEEVRQKGGASPAINQLKCTLASYLRADKRPELLDENGLQQVASGSGVSITKLRQFVGEEPLNATPNVGRYKRFLGKYMREQLGASAPDVAQFEGALDALIAQQVREQKLAQR